MSRSVGVHGVAKSLHNKSDLGLAYKPEGRSTSGIRALKGGGAKYTFNKLVRISRIRNSARKIERSSLPETG
jgi:hypothetical protein